MIERELRSPTSLAASVCAAAMLVTAACGGSGGEDRTEGGDASNVTAEAEAARDRNVVLGTFTPAEPPGGEPPGRLPAEGDRAIYVPATTLFPGSARLDPAIDNPYGGTVESIAAGERYYEAFNCGGCHAPLGGGGMGPPLSDEEWIYGSDPAQVFLSIMHGRPEGMPAWASMLPQRTAWEMVAYIETLGDIEDHAAEKGFETNIDRFSHVAPENYDGPPPDDRARD